MLRSDRGRPHPGLAIVLLVLQLFVTASAGLVHDHDGSTGEASSALVADHAADGLRLDPVHPRAPESDTACPGCQLDSRVLFLSRALSSAASAGELSVSALRLAGGPRDSAADLHRSRAPPTS